MVSVLAGEWWLKLRFGCIGVMTSLVEKKFALFLSLFFSGVFLFFVYLGSIFEHTRFEASIEVLFSLLYIPVTFFDAFLDEKFTRWYAISVSTLIVGIWYYCIGLFSFRLFKKK
jgi:hypothetical protein